VAGQTCKSHLLQRPRTMNDEEKKGGSGGSSAR
jgi:hypothetical protein